MSTPATTPVTPERIMQLAWGYVPPLVLEAAIRHRIFDLLDGGPKTVSEIQKETGASEGWPEVIPGPRKTVARFGLADRFSFVEGDLLQADFGSGHNLATLGHILHSEGSERSQALLKKKFQALAPGGTIGIAEFLVNADRTGPLNALFFAVNMLVNTERGDTYSVEEISSWLEAAGFTAARKLDAP